MNTEQKIQLTLEPEQAVAPASPSLSARQTVPDTAAQAPDSRLDESILTEDELRTVEAFAKQIDITDSTQVMQYGAKAQKNIAQFSESALGNVRNKDLGSVGDALASLVLELKQTSEPEPQGVFSRLFRKGKMRLEEMKAQYSRAEVSVEKIADVLKEHQVILMKDVAMLDQLYEVNKQYYKELTMYIIAGNKRLKEVRETQLEPLRQKAEQSKSQEDAQAYNDLANLCSRFEKKLHDLELTRVISIQMAPQTRLIQNNDTLMIEKIQTSLMNTIPLWKSQMVLALGLEHSRQATAAQTAVTDMTNELLRKNAEILRTSTVDTAREAERSIVDIETLQHTNQEFIATLDEVLRIQQEGREKRAAAVVEIRRIENDLKQKLLEQR